MSSVAPDAADSTADADGYYAQYFVHNAADVRRHLQRLVDGRCTLVANAEGAHEPVVTVLLQVEDASIWVDVPPGHATLSHWLSAPRLRFEGSIERVALRFACGPAVLDTHAGRPAVLLPVPERVLHLQRREFVRRALAPGALTCRLHPAADAKREVAATVHDIGGGGVALLADVEQMRFVVGDLLAGCRMNLPQLGEIAVDLCIRHVIERQQRGRTIAQAGCEFIQLGAAEQRKLFRYLMQLDREELARRRQFD